MEQKIDKEVFDKFLFNKLTGEVQICVQEELEMQIQ